MYYTTMDTRFCRLVLIGDEDGLKRLHMETGEGNREFDMDPEWERNDDVFGEAILQLQEYMDGRRTTFDLKLNPDGTDYQKKVWEALESIPYGETWTYKDIAVKTVNPKASRAVGAANGKNPIPIIVPCHRVIGTNGKLTGFAFGTAVKERMINHEMMVTVYNRLFDCYGEQHWWPASDDYEMMIGAILTQNTAWTNVEKAIANFEGRLTPQFVDDISMDALIDIIRPAGFFTQKAERLKSITNWFAHYDYDIEKARREDAINQRKELLDITGIGPETADCIMLYALRKPSFVIDAYTRRIFERLGMVVPRDYESFRYLFMDALPEDTVLFNEYHALIVEHAKQFCNKTPHCEGCPLKDICQF